MLKTILTSEPSSLTFFIYTNIQNKLIWQVEVN
mgnify:CR=1 FL=1